MFYRVKGTIVLLTHNKIQNNPSAGRNKRHAGRCSKYYFEEVAVLVND